jgi:hypothetical protein
MSDVDLIFLSYLDAKGNSYIGDELFQPGPDDNEWEYELDQELAEEMGPETGKRRRDF